MASKKKPKPSGLGHALTVVAGADGMAVYLNDFRIAGPKPWGEAVVRHEWKVSTEDLCKGIASMVVKP